MTVYVMFLAKPAPAQKHTQQIIDIEKKSKYIYWDIILVNIAHP